MNVKNYLICLVGLIFFGLNCAIVAIRIPGFASAMGHGSLNLINVLAILILGFVLTRALANSMRD